MGLLFRPRCPSAPLAGDAATYRGEAATGDSATDLEHLAHTCASDRVAADPSWCEVEFSAETQVVDHGGWSEWAVTDHQVTLRGVTVGQFDGSRIIAVRHYWDELARFDGLGVLPRD